MKEGGPADCVRGVLMGLQGPPVPMTCGLLALRAEIGSGNVSVEFTAAHFSESMGFAYYHSGMQGPVCLIDRTHSLESQKPSSKGHEGVSIFGARTCWQGKSINTQYLSLLA